MPSWSMPAGTRALRRPSWTIPQLRPTWSCEVRVPVFWKVKNQSYFPCINMYNLLVTLAPVLTYLESWSLSTAFHSCLRIIYARQVVNNTDFVYFPNYVSSRNLYHNHLLNVCARNLSTYQKFSVPANTFCVLSIVLLLSLFSMGKAYWCQMLHIDYFYRTKSEFIHVSCFYFLLVLRVVLLFL